MKYPTNVSSTKIESTHENEEDVNETNEEKIPKIETPKQVLERHAIEVKKEQPPNHQSYYFSFERL